MYMYVITNIVNMVLRCLWSASFLNTVVFINLAMSTT